MQLSSRVSVVTGGGRGIGRAAALALARAGSAVAVAARSKGDIESVAQEIVAAGGRAVAVSADVSKVEDVKALFRAAQAALGPVDVLVNGAGIAPTAPLAKTDDALWRSVIETNLSGAFYALREALPAMAARGFGRVVNVASIAGKIGAPYLSAYAASKHGLLGLTKCAALEVADKGVTVNAVCPGYVDTPMTDAGVEHMARKTGRPADEIRKRLELTSPQKRLMTAEEVAELILYLCGDDARGITGQAISLDGGTVL